MAEILVSPGISITETDKSSVVVRPIVAGAALIGPTVKGKVQVPTIVTSYSQYQQIFGTTFKDSNVQREFLTSMAAKYWFESNPNESLLVVRVADPAAFTVAKASLVSGGLELETLSVGAMLNNASVSGGTSTFDSGSGSKDNFKIQVVSGAETGSFSLIVRRGDDTDKDPIVLESFANLSLDPESPNYVSKVIGDQKEQLASGSVEFVGNYPNQSAYIRVSNVGTNAPAELSSSCYGFYSASGVVGTCYSGSTAVTGSTADYFENITDSSSYPQSVTPVDYETAIDLLANTDEYNFGIVSAPGLRSSAQIDKLVSLAESRGDCIAVIDLADCNDTVDAAATAASSANNSSYAATYFPWLQMYSATGKLEWVPASVAIPGVYSANDAIAAPWYVPAGMDRGIVNAVQARKKLVKADRDTLYKKNVNPIAVLPPVGLVAYGQKTLQKRASALDRVNVRRLLIELKKQIRQMASGLLFEQNTAALQNSFKSDVEAYLADVVRRNGLYAFNVDMSGNTPEAIDRNEFHCAIVLQPTKAIEYIYLSFTITSTGVDFE